MVNSHKSLSLQRRNLSSYINLALIRKRAADLANGYFNIYLLVKETVLFIKVRPYLLLKSIEEGVKIRCGRLLAPTEDKLDKLVFLSLISFLRALEGELCVFNRGCKGISSGSCLADNLKLTLEILVSICTKGLFNALECFIICKERESKVA